MKFLFSLITCLTAISTSAQSPSKLTGTWEGKINVGVSLRIVFIFEKDSAGIIIGTCYSPDQGNQPIPCSGIRTQNDSLTLGITSLKVTFAGKFESDSVITGKLTQSQPFDLTLKKVLKVSELSRPQTPHPPLSYKSEELEYFNSDKSIHYGATITIPTGKAPFAAVLLITGSGPQNRDEEIAGHKPFAVIADHLTKNGFVVLRVDDRGIGKSSGTFASATTADFAADVNAAINYLKTRKEVDVKRIGLLGHSEGGMIAPMVAAQRDDINFIVLLAAPGEKISALMREQNVAVLKSYGINENWAEEYGKLYADMMPAVAKTNISEGKAILYTAVNNWIAKTPKDVVKATTGIVNDSTKNQFINAFVSSSGSAWFKYFVQFDPAPYLTKLHCKVLALNGEKDLQVSSKTNLEGIRNALRNSKSPLYDVSEVPGVNHLFQNCKTCTINEYSELEETFSPAVLDIISNWLKKNVRRD